MPDVETLPFAAAASSGKRLRYTVVESPLAQDFEKLLNKETERIINTHHLIDVKYGRTDARYSALLIWREKTK